jgi:hypothetical protein
MRFKLFGRYLRDFRNDMLGSKYAAQLQKKSTRQLSVWREEALERRILITLNIIDVPQRDE